MVENSRGSTGARVTQRAPQSCQRCSAKKMRCSKTVPCDSCVSQGVALQCRREQVIVTKHIRSTKSQHQRARNATSTNTAGLPGASPSDAASSAQHRVPTGSGNSGESSSPNHEETAAVLLDLAQQPPGQNISFEDVFDIGGSGLALTPGGPGASAPTPTSNAGAGGRTWSVFAEPGQQSPSSSPQDEVSPFETTVTSLEFLVWGRHRDSDIPAAAALIAVQRSTEADILSPRQALEVIKYHWNWLTWTHNIIHWPQFKEECQLYWNDGFVKEKAWLALYYAVLCVGLHHMTPEQRVELGLTIDGDAAEKMYHKCVDALKDADYASVHTLTNVQAICLLVLCAHDFNGSNLLAVLLSSAIRIAQALNVHRLGPDPVEPLPYRKAVQREIRKSIWAFLSTQDWFMIPFSNAHSISPDYCTTPPPIHCNAISGVGVTGSVDSFKTVSMEEPTLMSYQLFMLEVASVFRAFFDETSRLPTNLEPDMALRKLYDHVLKADSQMGNIVKTLPRYLRLDCSQANRQLPCYIPRQRYHLAISIAHKTLTIHRRFFLKSLTDRWYNYTKVTCVNCARTILTQFRANSDESTSRNLWTVLAHVVSASIILLLEMIFPDDNSFIEDSCSKRELVVDCLVLLKNSNKTSSISVRGTELIELLLNHTASTTDPSSSDGERHGVGAGTASRLDLKEIAAYLAADKSSTNAGGEDFSFAGILDFDLGDLDAWMEY